MADKTKKRRTWDEVKQLCQLSDEAIKMAKELRLTPGMLMKTLEVANQPGKLSVENWVRNLHKKQNPDIRKVENEQKNKEAKKQVPNKVISFPASAKSAINDKESVKKPKLAKTTQTEKKLEEIRKLVLKLEDDVEEFPIKLWDLIHWMVENKKEPLIREMMVEEEIPDAGLFALDFVLKDIGYRYPVSLPIEGKKGKVRWEDFELIPFGILFLVPVADEKLNHVPTKALKAIEKITKDKLLRKALLLGDKPGIILDPHLYHVDHDEWVQESSVMKYLSGFAPFIVEGKDLKPLTMDYKRPSLVAKEKVSPDVPHFCLVMRVLCGVIMADEDEALDVEEQVFDSLSSVESEDELETVRKSWEKIEEILINEFEHNGIEVPNGIFVNPSAVEFWDIPQVSISLSRILPIQLELHNAIAQLEANAEEGEIFTPILYVSQHGENDQIQEIRLAAYGDPNQGAFFRYVWEINPDLDDPEDVANTVIAIANELDAEVVAIDGLRPNDRCPDCGDVLFYGPGEDGDTVIHNHEEYIN